MRACDYLCFEIRPLQIRTIRVEALMRGLCLKVVVSDNLAVRSNV